MSEICYIFAVPYRSIQDPNIYSISVIVLHKKQLLPSTIMYEY